MSEWECIICGLVYDEELGDPDSGVAPDTRWEDIPDSWLCPECGVTKEDFRQLGEAGARFTYPAASV